MPKTAPRPPSASPEMAARLTINRTGQFTPGQRRVSLIVGLLALLIFLCPLAMVVQLVMLLFVTDAPAVTISSIVITAVGVLFLIVFGGLVGTNAHTFLGEAFMRRPVHHARGPLEIRVTEGDRPELPFSYIIDDYSFAPYVVPSEVPMQAGAPYIAYYAARSRLLLSIAALDAPDGDQWLPESEPVS
jgi:hypothetical protein